MISLHLKYISLSYTIEQIRIFGKSYNSAVLSKDSLPFRDIRQSIDHHGVYTLSVQVNLRISKLIV